MTSLTSYHPTIEFAVIFPPRSASKYCLNADHADNDEISSCNPLNKSTARCGKRDDRLLVASPLQSHPHFSNTFHGDFFRVAFEAKHPS